MGELGHPVGRRPCRDGCGVDDAGAGREFHVAMLFGRGREEGEERMDGMGDRVSPNKGLEVGQHCGRLSFDGTTMCVGW